MRYNLKFKAQSSIAHLHMIFSFLLILFGFASSYFAFKPPTEFWMIVTAFISNSSTVFEFFFGKPKKELYDKENTGDSRGLEEPVK